MTLLQLFYRFLKINNIYNLFLYNMSHREYELSWQYNIENIKIYTAYNLINDAFTWRDTKEGFDFWSKFNARWREIILFSAKRYETLISILSNKEIKINDELIKMLKV